MSGSPKDGWRVDGLGPGQNLSSAEMIVEEKAGRTGIQAGRVPGSVRQHETQACV